MHPVPYPITTPYGVPGNWAAGMHTGQDYACPEGTPVLAAAGGTVRLAEWQGDYGYRVDVQTNDNTRQHSYSHLKNIQAWPGQHLAVGQPIGLSGNTGRSTGPHLHYEERVSPFGYWDHAAPILTYDEGPDEGKEDEEDDMRIIWLVPGGVGGILTGTAFLGIGGDEAKQLRGAGWSEVTVDQSTVDIWRRSGVTGL